MKLLNRHLAMAPKGLPERLCDAFFIFFGTWTLSWHLIYFSGGSFQVARVLPAVILLGVGTLLYLGRRSYGGAGCPENGANPGDRVPLFVFSLMGVLLVLFGSRPDADDEHYLARAIRLLADPATPVQELAGFGTGYGITSYIPLKAAVAQLTGLPLLDSYYLLVPALLAVLLVVVSWRLLRMLSGEGILIGFLFFFVVMIAWAEVHRTHANFGFLRLFQGKACLVSIVVPAIIYYFFRMLQNAFNGYDLTLLFFALVSAIGFTPTGIIVGPLLTGLLLVSALLAGALGRRRQVALLLGSGAMVLMLALIMKLYFGVTTTGVHVGGGLYPDSATNLEIYARSLGKGLRSLLLILCLALSIGYVADPRIRSSYRNFVLLLLAMLAFPWTSELIAEMTYRTMSWRWLWVIPFPILAAVTVAGVYRESRQLVGTTRTRGFFLAFLVLFFLASPRWILSDMNHASLAWPGPKLESERVFLRFFGEYGQVRDRRIYIGDRTTGY